MPCSFKKQNFFSLSFLFPSTFQAWGPGFLKEGVRGRGGTMKPTKKIPWLYECMAEEEWQGHSAPLLRTTDLTPYCHRAGTLLPRRTCLWFIATSYNNLLSLRHHCIASVMALVHCYGPFRLLTARNTGVPARFSRLWLIMGLTSITASCRTMTWNLRAGTSLPQRTLSQVSFSYCMTTRNLWAGTLMPRKTCARFHCAMPYCTMTCFYCHIATSLHCITQ